jgi:hypothetical protein
MKHLQIFESIYKFTVYLQGQTYEYLLLVYEYVSYK